MQGARVGHANGAHVRAREGAEWGMGAPRATEPGCGAEPHTGNTPLRMVTHLIMSTPEYQID